MPENLDLGAVEERLRSILTRYELAQTRGDLLEAIFGIHTALEDALACHAAADTAEGQTFGEAMAEMLPGGPSSAAIDALCQARNRYAHPEQLYVVTDYRDTAMGYVDLALAAWIELFGGPPPNVRHPSLARVITVSPMAIRDDEGTAPRQESEPEAPRAGRTGLRRGHAPSKASTDEGESAFTFPARFSVRGTPLLLGLFLLLLVSVLVGFAAAAASREPVAWLWLVLAAGMALAASAGALALLWPLIRILGPLRLLAGLAILLLVATLALVPFTAAGQSFAERAGASLTRVLSFAGRTLGFVPQRLADGGANMAGLVVPGIPTATAIKVVEPTATATAVPTATATPAPTATPTATPVPETPTPPPGVVAIGARVIVATEGADLLARTDPGIAAPIEARFPNGSELLVVDGPQEADGITWWQVQNEEATGWSAGQYLQPVPAGQ